MYLYYLKQFQLVLQAHFYFFHCDIKNPGSLGLLVSMIPWLFCVTENRLMKYGNSDEISHAAVKYRKFNAAQRRTKT
ncbi:MAG: hypothetical protein C0403_06465 [Desulfobacterium sp.]|nr:hypothetical protein [Desulfobacterium sp.]